jgi:hypothetical protein
VEIREKGLSELEPETVVECSMVDELSHKSHRSKQNFGEKTKNLTFVN